MSEKTQTNKPKTKAEPKAKANAAEQPKGLTQDAAAAPEGGLEATGIKAAPTVTAADLLKAEVADVSKIRRAKGSKNVHQGVVHILATFNNTKVTFTDTGGNVIAASSSGRCGFKGSRKSTAYAAQVVTQEAAKVAVSHGMKEVSIRLSGAGMGREAGVRALQVFGFSITGIHDVTPIPHNGCRPPKRRRV